MDEFKASELAASRRPLTVLARVRSGTRPFMIFDGQNGSGAFFFSTEYFGFSLVIIIPPMPHIHLHLHDALTSFYLKLNTLYLEIKLILRVM